MSIKKDRRWQKLAWSQYIADNAVNWLIEACPGSGKTYWALRLVIMLRDAGIIERIVVVVPTDHLRDQWIQAAKRLNIHLASIENGDGGCENRDDFVGCVLTYAQVAMGVGPDVHRRACGLYLTLAIFDEVHHAGKNKTWGNAIEEAFEPAVKRISMTGTPWRRPRHGKIPFVRYNDDGIVDPDFRYTTTQAVQQNYVRAVHSHAFDGTLKYQRLDIDSCVPIQPTIVQLGEMEEDDSKVLQDILEADGPWLRSIFRNEAMPRLAQIMGGDEDCPAIPSAQGLIVVNDRVQARKAVKFVRKLAHENSALIINPDAQENDPDPKCELKRFKAGECKWAVAVDMVSEGVDIPNIFVIIYATRKKTLLRVKQTVARAQRKIFEEHEYEPWAQVLYPAVPSFMEVFSQIEQDMTEAFKYIEEEDNDDEQHGDEGEYRPRKADGRDPMESVTLSDATYYGTMAGGQFFSQHTVRTKEAWLEMMGVPAKYAINFLLDEHSRGEMPIGDEPAKDKTSLQEAEEMTKQDEWNLCRTALDKTIGQVALKLVQGDYSRIGEGKKLINIQMKRWFNGKKRAHFSIAQFKEAIRRVKSMSPDGGTAQD